MLTLKGLWSLPKVGELGFVTGLMVTDKNKKRKCIVEAYQLYDKIMWIRFLDNGERMRCLEHWFIRSA